MQENVNNVDQKDLVSVSRCPISKFQLFDDNLDVLGDDRDAGFIV